MDKTGGKSEKGRIVRFAVVGVCNAAISFGVLNLAYYHLHQGKITSSILATSCALAFSFVMNRGFVFGDKTKRAYRQLPVFVIVTVTGSLLLLNAVYILSIRLLNGHERIITVPIHTVTGVMLSRSFVDINVATVIGAIAALIWNYNGYRWFVFKGKHSREEQEVQLTI